MRPAAFARCPCGASGAATMTVVSGSGLPASATTGQETSLLTSSAHVRFAATIDGTNEAASCASLVPRRPPRVGPRWRPRARRRPARSRRSPSTVPVRTGSPGCVIGAWLSAVSVDAPESVPSWLGALRATVRVELRLGGFRFGLSNTSNRARRVLPSLLSGPVVSLIRRRLPDRGLSVKPVRLFSATVTGSWVAGCRRRWVVTSLMPASP